MTHMAPAAPRTSASSRPLVAVTGADGFIGSHLTEELVRAGYRVRAMAIYNSQGSYGWLDQVGPDVMQHVEVQLGDVRDAGSVRELMRGAQTTYHLAALIAIPYSYVAPRSYVDTNVTGTLNVLEAARDLGTARVVHTSTSEVYGTARTVPIHETHPLQGQSPYAASKIAADQLALQAWLGFGLEVLRVRAFNHLGPGQSTNFVAPGIADRIARNERDGVSAVPVGNLTPRRDITDVRDVVRAYRLLIEHGEPGEAYNVCSGRDLAIAELAELLVGMANVPMHLEADPDLQRPVETPVLLGDPTRIRQTTGWVPEISIETTLADVLDDRRRLLA